MNEHVPADAPRPYLASLLRLWTLRKVASPPSGRATPIVVCLSALWLSAVAGHRLVGCTTGSPQFAVDDAPLLAWYALAVLGLAALLRWRSKPEPPYGAVLVLVTGLGSAAAAARNHRRGSFEFSLAVGLAAASPPATRCSTWRAACAPSRANRSAWPRLPASPFVVGFLWLSDALDVIPDVWAPREAQASTTDERCPATRRACCSSNQAASIGRLQPFSRDASAAPKAFFLGFAGVGEQKVFAQEIGLASRVLAERYGMDGRALSLINDQRDLERRAARERVGIEVRAARSRRAHESRSRRACSCRFPRMARKDPAIAVSNSDLPLNDMTDEDLAEALDDSGIKWRVIIISACYAGGFIDALKNPQTIVIAAAAADRTSFGCSNDRDLTYFGEAFYRDALARGAHVCAIAFDTAKAAIAAARAQRARRCVAARRPILAPNWRPSSPR